jgi:hypothetical protein
MLKLSNSFRVHEKLESKMTNKMPLPESDDARSGDDADKKREELSKAAQKGLKGTIEPTFTVPERPSKLDPFADKLSG